MDSGAAGKSVDVSKVKDLLLRDMWTLELYKHPQVPTVFTGTVIGQQEGLEKR